MMRPIFGAVVLVCGLAGIGCGGDDDDDSSGGSGNTAGSTSSGGNSGSGGSNSTGGGSAISDRCREGCMLVIEAACPISPDSQESCESDCSENETGACGTEYDAFQDCAEGKGITCAAIGIPTVEGCENEQNVFITCIN